MSTNMPEGLLSRLSDFLVAEIGLSFPKERWGDLERGIAGAAREFGFKDTAACIRWLLSAPLTRGQIETLAGFLTVGETYFFRERRNWEILEEHILPELVRARGKIGWPIRIWSASCCTGEEPFSIAMLIDKLGMASRKHNVTILATDINPRFLRKAAEGVYGEWSFRDTPAWIRERYFTTTRGGKFQIKPHIRRMVTFSYLNLVADAYPSLASNTNAMDVILCRNVLMYFATESARKVIANLYRSLVNGGWLIVSATETSTSLFSGFTPVEFPGGVLYRKMTGPAPRAIADYFAAMPDMGSGASLSCSATAPPTPAAPDTAQLLPPEEALQGPDRSGTAGLDDPSPRVKDTPETPSDAARACANEGRLAEAVEWCGKAIAADKLNAASYYLLAAIQQERGESDAAARALDRALYLDPDFVLAHFVLGNLRLSQGRSRDADRYFANALALLRGRPQNEGVPESEGMTAGRLTEIITFTRLGLARGTVREA